MMTGVWYGKFLMKFFRRNSAGSTASSRAATSTSRSTTKVASGRPVDPCGGPRRHHFLGIDEDFRAEAAAHIGRDHAQLVLGRHPHEGGNDEPRDMRVLGRVPEREALAAGVVLADRGARLHGVRH